jgi:hypothetical protein
MLLCIFHVFISLGKPNIGGTGSLVGSQSPGIGIDCVRVRFRFTSSDSDASRVGTRFASVGGKFALVGIRFARIGANASRIGVYATKVGTRFTSIGGKFAHVGIHFSSVGCDASRVGLGICRTRIGDKPLCIGWRATCCAVLLARMFCRLSVVGVSFMALQQRPSRV